MVKFTEENKHLIQNIVSVSEFKNQSTKLFEELCEFMQTVCKKICDDSMGYSEEKTTEEIADVYITLAQFIIFLNLNVKDIERYIDMKLYRRCKQLVEKGLLRGLDKNNGVFMVNRNSVESESNGAVSDGIKHFFPELKQKGDKIMRV